MKPQSTTRAVCVICGREKNLQHNHAGGRNHIAWFTVPFCDRHHQQFHRLLESVGINLRYTPNKLKRLVMAALALTIALWMVLQALWEAVSALPDEDTLP
jgi:hypothetical protein